MVTTATDFDPLSPLVQRDPYPRYQQPRAAAPVRSIESVAEEN
jgi:hypothetical protein